MVGLFDRVGLRTNVRKTVRMICCMCQARGDTVGGGVREKDYGRGTFVPGAAEGTGPVQGVLVGNGDWVSGKTHADTAWEGSVGEMELGSHRPW